MCSPGVKLGLYLPATLHDRMIASARGRPRGALQAAYATAVRNLLEVVDTGAKVVVAAVRGPKATGHEPAIIPRASARPKRAELHGAEGGGSELG